MVTDWVLDELMEVSTGDPRLDRRVLSTVSMLSAKSDASILEASPTHKELVGAYRMLDNVRVQPSHILNPHIKSSIERSIGFQSVTIAHDTTEISVTHAVKGMGKTTKKKYSCYAHASMAYAPDGAPLGLINADIWTRDSTRKTRKTLGKTGCSKIPFEQRESYKWLRGTKKVVELAQKYPDTDWINVCDSESDMYSFYEYCEGTGLSNLHYVIRACQDMRRTRLTSDPSEEPKTLREQVELHRAQKPFDVYTMTIRDRKAPILPANKRHGEQEGREATVEVRRFSVNLCSPVKAKKSSTSMIRVNVVYLKEAASPQVKTPVEWILITSLPIKTRKDCLRVRKAYEQRWQIELYFRILKGGCDVENKKLRDYSRFAKCLSIYMVIAWRIDYITYVARHDKESSCERVFHKKEWQAIEAYFNKGKVRKKKPPKLQELILNIARLGGYKPRKTMPGVETIWRGLKMMDPIVYCWILFT